VVGVEVLILEGYGRGAETLWHFRERNEGAFFLAMYFVEEMLPGAIVDFG
jgi:hypothetical protein